jgi:succinate dehydrogenase/fumarate reductase iron-sulfur protein
MPIKNINVKVFRYSPTNKDKAHYQVYKVPIEEGMSVLDVLDYIYENIDSTISYFSHAACRNGVCGNCSLIVNGKSTLACQAQVKDDLVIDVPKNLKVIKDLIYEQNKN